MFSSGELNELLTQREAIQESLCESIFDGSTAAVEFFRFLMVDIDHGIEVMREHLVKTKS